MYPNPQILTPEEESYIAHLTCAFRQIIWLEEEQKTSKMLLSKLAARALLQYQYMNGQIDKTQWQIKYDAILVLVDEQFELWCNQGGQAPGPGGPGPAIPAPKRKHVWSPGLG